MIVQAYPKPTEQPKALHLNRKLNNKHIVKPKTPPQIPSVKMFIKGSELLTPLHSRFSFQTASANISKGMGIRVQGLIGSAC